MKPKIRLLLKELLLLLLLLIVSVLLLNRNSVLDDINTPITAIDAPEIAPQVQQQNMPTSTERTQPERSVQEKSAWNLILSSENYPLEAEWIGTIDKKALPNGLEVDARIFDALTSMLQDADALGHDLIVCSAYRSYEKQQSLFDAQMQQNIQAGLTQQESYNKTKTSIAIPGTSEHHTGLAVDIVPKSHQVLNEAMLQTPEIRWLYAHCHEYGFIVRYPEGKSHITGIIHEPWHYRYVGVAAATEIMQNNSTLEEFLGME